MKMAYDVYIVPDDQDFGEGLGQYIATFENVNEEFMNEITEYISTIRDVKCAFVERIA